MCMLGQTQKRAVSGSTLGPNPSVLPGRLTKGATVPYSRKSEDTSTSEAAPIPHHTTLNPRVTATISKYLQNPKKGSRERLEKFIAKEVSYEERAANEQPAPRRPDLLLAAPGCAAHDPAGVPEALRGRRRWMGTRFKPRKGQPGKLDKPPYRVVEGQPIIKADKTNPANWSTYRDALAAYERGAVDAIGYVVTDGDPEYVVDQDDVVDPLTGEIDGTASEIVHTLDSYTEVSCSGRGVHTVAQGKKPDFAKCKTNALGFGVEVYDSARFVVLTGRRISGRTTVEDRQRELDELCRRLWPEKPKASPKSTRRGRRRRLRKRVGESDPREGVGVDDRELLERARRSRTGAKFRALYDAGDTTGYASASEADYGLLNMLIFWTAGDGERIARLFEASALYRGKEKHRDYVRRSVDAALASYSGSFYRPRAVRDTANETDQDHILDDPLAPYLGVLLDPSRWTGKRSASAFKAYAALVILADECGIVDDDGNLRIGCDTRRLAEVAGMTKETLSRSALPYLMQEMKLLGWKRGNGAEAGVFVLKNRGSTTHANKVTTHFIGVSSAPPEITLEILRMFIRMRYGHAKNATLLRLGMPAMFVAIALAADGLRSGGYTLEEIAERTGRRARVLDSPNKKDTPMKCLKAAGIIQQHRDGTYSLADGFMSRYEQHLELSGITYSERAQRYRHEEDRRRRDAEIPTDKRRRKLRGKEHMRRVQERNRKQAREQWIEEQRQKVGTTATTFLDDELKGVQAVTFAALKRRWLERGGAMDDLWRAIHFGPWHKYRESDGGMCVARDPDADSEATPELPKPKPKPREAKPPHGKDGGESPPTGQIGRVERLTYEGMSPRLARAEVLGEEVF